MLDRVVITILVSFCLAEAKTVFTDTTKNDTATGTAIGLFSNHAWYKERKDSSWKEIGRHADSSDTAAFAHVAQRALGLKLGFGENIVPVVWYQDSTLRDRYRAGAAPDTYSADLHYTPFFYSTSASSGTWGPALTLYTYPSTLYNSSYFSVTTLGNGYAGTRAAIELRNFNTVASGRETALLSWRKRDATSSSHNDFELLTCSQPYATTWLRHIFINGETGEMIFQDTCPDVNRTVRYPARFKNGGIRTSNAFIDTAIAFKKIPGPVTVPESCTVIFNQIDDGFSQMVFAAPDGATKYIADGTTIVRNTGSDTIPIGHAVRASGATGTRSNVRLAIATEESLAVVIGIAMANIPPNSFGRIQTDGRLRDHSFAGLDSGKIAYLSSTDSGHVTTTHPLPPLWCTKVGYTTGATSPGNASLHISIEAPRQYNYVDSARIAGSAYHGVPSGRHAVSTGTSTWGQSTIREADSCVGIGVASSDDRRLAVSFSPVNESGYGLFLAYSPTVTADVYGGGSAARILALTNVASPYTDLNQLIGIGGYAFHNSTGRCYGGVYGLQFEYGTLGATTGRLDRGVGVYIGGRSDGVGPVNLLQDIYIAARTGTVTPDVEWCIYSDHRATSSFVGRLQSGTTGAYTTADSLGLTLWGTATEWDDEKIVATAFDYIGIGDPDVISWTVGSYDNVVRVYQSGDKAYFTCQFSHGRVSGSNIYAHIHWTPHVRGNEENGSTVNWVLGKTWAGIDSTFPAMDTIWLNDTCTGIDNRHLMTRDIMISGTGKGTSSILTGYVQRAAGDTWVGTTAAQSPGFLEIDFHYEIDKLGSNNPTSD